MTKLNLDELRDPGNELSAQQIFDAVWQYFVVENAPRSMGAGQCMYRHGNGACCAVGLFLTDDLARQLDACVDSEVSYVEHSLPHNIRKHVYLLEALQRAHDYAWVRQPRDVSMRCIAANRGLTVPE